jgi:DNA-binding IclR family transcriptional regulator
MTIETMKTAATSAKRRSSETGVAPETSKAKASGMDVKTAGRTVELFELFARTQQPLSLTEISRALEAPLSSCLYLVRSLESRGYLYGLGAQRQIYPTQKLFEIGKAISVGESWVSKLEPVLERLRDATAETVILGKRQGNRIVYLAVYEGPQTIRYSSRVGDVKPMHASAIGKAILSSLDATELKKLLPKLSLDAVTPATLTDRDALTEDLKKAAKRGYARTHGEHVVDVMALAKAIVIGHERYGIAIAGPLYRMNENAASHVERLFDTCHEVDKIAKLRVKADGDG